MEQADFVKGALIGGCIGSVLAFFIAPSSGKQLREDIVKGYNTLHNQTNEYIDDIKEQAQHAIDTLQGKEEPSHNAFLIGSVSGAIIGAVAGLLLAPQSGHKLRQHLGEEYDDICKKAQSALKGVQRKGHDLEGKIDEWKDIFETVVDRLATAAPKVRKQAGSGLDEIVNWANLGLRFYNQLQARR